MTEHLLPSSDTRPPQDAPRRSWLVARGLIPESMPQRVLALVSFINMLGTGLYMAAAALYFTRSVGLSVAEVGLGMGVSTIVGLLSGIPAGHIADRTGPREVYRWTLLAQAVAMAMLVFAHTFWVFLVLLSLTQLTGSASVSARGPLVRGIGKPNVTAFRAYLRSAANLAGSLGAIGAGIAVQLDTRGAYVTLILVNAASFAVCAALVNLLPSLPPVAAPPGTKRWIALKDKPYMLVTLLDGIMWIQGQVLVFAVPLWIVLHTNAPRWFVGVAVVLNTGMVVALQVKASRGIDTGSAAARALRRAGVAFLLGMALIALAEGLPAWLSVVLMLAGIAVHTVGELWHAASSMELRFRLAPEHAQGQYTGVFGFGMAFANAVSPSVLGLLCITWGKPGWFLMGALFVVVGLVFANVIRWAERNRPETADID